MSITITITLFVASFFVLLLIIALFMKRNHFCQRGIIIHAPRQKVFDFLKLLKNQEQFNKWAKADQERNWVYKGTDGTVGFVISWNGNKEVGEGEKEITNLIEGKKIETQIRFVRPMKTTADVIFEMESVSEEQTRLTMSNAGTLKYPVNIMIPIVEKMFPKDMEESLIVLKTILES